MRAPNDLPTDCYSALLSSLGTLAEGCPGLPPTTPSLHRLRNLVVVVQGSPPARPSAVPPSPSLAHSLSLVSATQGLLTVLRDAGAASPVGGEMSQRLTETLSKLAVSVGAAIRQEQAHRTRGLYVIIDPQATEGRDPLDIANAAIRGGARMLQLRHKLGDKGEILPLAMPLQQLCQANDALLVINDHVDLAAVVGSGGVHLGQTDMPVAQARQVLASHQMVGRSNHEIEELILSQEMGADHVAFGPIYHTDTKAVGHAPQGIERLCQAREVTTVPLVAIGGINAENVAPVVEAGADAVCVTAAVSAAPDPEAAASRLVESILAAGGRV